MDSSAAAIAPEAPAAKPPHGGRITGIDAGRYIAVLMVIFIHTYIPTAFGTTMELAARFSVPYFFMVSGFFATKRSGSFVEASLRLARRLLFPFLVWVVVYMLVWPPPAHKFTEPAFYVNVLLNGGPGFHLWFIPSLLLCSILLMGMIRLGWSLRVFVIIAAALYLIGLVLGPYCQLLTGDPGLERTGLSWILRDGPTFGLPFMIAGFVIARTKLRLAWPWAALMALAGALLQVAELVVVQQVGQVTGHDQFFGTLLYCLGFFFLAESLPEAPITAWAARLGRYSLGIFLSHVLFIVGVTWLASRGWFANTRTDLGELAAWAVVAVIATAFCVAIGRVRWLRPLVR